MICFKEWQVICDALKSGRQSLILRKGGIHEGKGGFSFGNVEQFTLFPTRFHAQGNQVSIPTSEAAFSIGKEWEIGDRVVFDTLCKVDTAIEITDWNVVESVLPHHIWSNECIQDRFHWEGKGMASGSIHLALLRVYTLESPLMTDYQKRLSGCRSWVEIPELELGSVLTPVLSDETFASLKHAILQLIPTEQL